MAYQGKFLQGGFWHNRADNKTIDLTVGGQFGWASDYEGIINSTPHTTNNVICRVLSSPRGFNLLEGEAQTWHAHFKALFELHPKSITGLNQTLNPDWTSTPWNGTGEELEVPVGMKRAKSDVTCSFVEKYGLVITQSVEAYHRLFIMDEDTKHPGIALLNNENMHDGLIDFYTWTLLFIEPGRYLEQVNNSWLMTNVSFKNSVDRTAKRDKNSSNDTLEFDLNLTGVTQVGWGVHALATNVLKQMRATQADPYRAPAFLKGPTADISDRNNTGFYEAMVAAQKSMLNKSGE